jgi:serine/threonine-protein kinase
VVKTSITATVAGVVKGKWSYMSPEQISSGPVDQRSDLFSLGVVLYELATGARLFRGDSIGATAVRVMKATIPPPRSVAVDIDPRLDAILMKALTRDPQARYQSAAALAADLEAYRASRTARITSARLGTIVRMLFPEEGSSGTRTLAAPDSLATDLRKIETINTGALMFDEDVKIEFEPDAVVRKGDTIASGWVVAIAMVCLAASVAFWSIVY